MMTDILTITMVRVECCVCHIQFAMTKDFYRDKRHDHLRWYCPNGHIQHYTAQSEEERLREANDYYKAREAQLCEQRDRLARQNAAQRGQTTRLRNRIKAGVCPCCHRTFAGLAQHMAIQHPEWQED
jgi:hypothetical protein